MTNRGQEWRTSTSSSDFANQLERRIFERMLDFFMTNGAEHWIMLGQDKSDSLQIGLPSTEIAIWPKNFISKG